MADDLWTFDHVAPGGQSRIDWAFDLPSGGRFSDAAHDRLRGTAKRFVLSLRTHPPLGRPPRADCALVRTFGALRALIRWMDAEGIKRFADLDPAAARRFLATMAERRHPRTGAPLAPKTLRVPVALLDELWLQAPRLEDALPADPLEGSLIDRQEEPRYQNPGLPYAPDEVAMPLIAAAIRLVGQPAENVIALRDLVQRHYDAALVSGQTKAGRLAVAAARSFRFATLPGEDGPWEPHPLASTKRLRYLIDRVIDACFVLVAWLVGPRISEIAGLQIGCIEERPAADGAETYAYLVGRIWKTAGPGGRAHRWVVPAPVVRAIAVMERLSEPMRRRTGRQELWLAMGSSGMIGPAARISPATASSWNRRLNGGFAPYIRLPAYQGRPWRLSTHQGRKTFARMVGRRDRAGLDALKAHLGHVSRAMTDRGYVGTDFDLRELADRHALDETRTALEALLTAPRLGGRAGRKLVARSRFRGRTVDAEVRAWVDHILRETDMRLGACDWGWCVYQPEASACLGDERGPNPALRTESVCAGCANFAVAPRHRPVWEARRRRNVSLLGHPGLDAGSRALAEERVAECDRILLALDGGPADQDGDPP